MRKDKDIHDNQALDETRGRLDTLREEERASRDLNEP